MKFQQHFDRIFTHLPSKGDLSLMTLKGHLLAEGLLEKIIRQFCARPEVLESLQIHFVVKAAMARALVGDIQNKKLWELVGLLNNIRNHYGHQLESTKVRGMVVKFIETKHRDAGHVMPKIQNDEQLARMFGNAITYVLGGLMALEGAVIEHKAKGLRRVALPSGEFKAAK
ncbi:MAG: hypothetical protein HYY78_02040 [Betaproteobacteria bacterium]|nr:hypothetical protein [Betaproteobacteria bacterium]